MTKIDVGLIANGFTQSTMVFILLLFCAGTQGFYASDKITLPDSVGKPEIILAHSGKLFIAERATVHIFALPGLSHIRTFGQKGAGPGDFRSIKGVHVANNRLHFSSVMEVNIFSLEGDFLKRLRTNHFVIAFIPFKDKYVGWDSPRETDKKYVRARLFDSNLKTGTFLYKYLNFIQKNNNVPFLFHDEFSLPIGDRLYINTPEGKILCFDADGKLIKTINPNLKKVPISEEFRENLLNFYRNTSGGKILLQMHGKRLFMPDHCPFLVSMGVDKDNLLLVTYERKKGYLKVMVLDRDGNRIGTKGVPFVFKYAAPIGVYPYSIYENKLYQLAENERAETWEVHITPLPNWNDIK